MESMTPRPTPEDELRQLERASTEHAIAAMPVPNWVWLAVTVAGWTFAAGHAIGDFYQTALPVAAWVGIILISRKLQRDHGVIASPFRQPRALTLLRIRWLIETLFLGAAMWFLAVKVNRWAAVALTGPLFAMISYRHDQRAEAATAAMRARRSTTTP